MASPPCLTIHYGAAAQQPTPSLLHGNPGPTPLHTGIPANAMAAVQLNSSHGIHTTHQDPVAKAKTLIAKYKDDSNFDKHGFEKHHELTISLEKELKHTGIEVRQALIAILIQKKDISLLIDILSNMDWAETSDHDKLRDQVLQAATKHVTQEHNLNSKIKLLEKLNPSQNNQESALQLANTLAENSLRNLQSVLIALKDTACAINQENTLILVTKALSIEKILTPARDSFDEPDQNYADLINHLSTFHSIQSVWLLVSQNETTEKNAPLGWLVFLATQLLRTTNNCTKQEKEVLLETCQAIAALEDPILQHALGQMLGRQLKNPQSIHAFLNTLSTHFSSNPYYGIIFLHGLPQATDTELNLAKQVMACIAKVCPNPATGNIHEGLWLLMASSTIERKTKTSLLSLLSTIESGNNEVFSQAIANLTAIMCSVAHSPLAEAYQDWLPLCRSLEDLELGAKPSRTFLLGQIEQRLIKKCFGAHLIWKATSHSHISLPIAADPLHLTTAEKIACIQKALQAWVALKDSHFVFFEKTDYVNNAFFEYNAIDCPELKNQHKTIQEIIDTHNNTEDEATKSWLNHIAILALGIAPEVLDKTCMAETLKNIAHIRGASQKYSTTQCWFYIAQNATLAESFEEFKQAHCPQAYTQNLAPALFVLSGHGEHLEHLQVLLRIVQNRTFKDGKKFTTLLEFMGRLALNNTLNAKEKCLAIQKATEPLQFCTRKEEAEAFKSGTSPELSCMVAILELHANNPNNETFEALLGELKTTTEIQSLMPRLLSELLNTTHNSSQAKNYAEQYERHTRQARQPFAFLNYASHCIGHLKGDDQQKTQAWLAPLLAALSNTMLHTQGRYNTTGENTHNAFLQNNAARAWAVWKEQTPAKTPAIESIQYSDTDLIAEVVDVQAYLHERIIVQRHVLQGTFPTLEAVLSGQQTLNIAQPQGKAEEILLNILTATQSTQPNKAELNTKLNTVATQLRTLKHTQLAQDVIDLQKKLNAPPLNRQKCESLRVSISSHAEDLFLCGTEVIGSCQSIYSGDDFNKTLVAYVLDGKYKMAQITQPNGTLMARRMLRLLWSEDHQKPVIHIEQEYSNPGVPAKTKAILLRLVYEKAQAMGALLATNDKALLRQLSIDEDEEFMARIIDLRAYASPYPYEYVDALGGIQEKGDYEIEARPLPSTLPRHWPI